MLARLSPIPGELLVHRIAPELGSVVDGVSRANVQKFNLADNNPSLCFIDKGLGI